MVPFRCETGLKTGYIGEHPLNYVIVLLRATPREVCSLSMNSFFSLTEIQKQVLVGTLLGDGGLRYKGNNCRLHIKHSYNQVKFVEYKRQIYSSITSMSLHVFSQKVHEKSYRFVEFVTRTHPELTEFYRLFYPDGKKRVPQNISTLLYDPLSLAVWFMDDGSAEYAGASLQTHSFTKQDVQLLMKTLKNNFNLDVSRRLNKGNWIVYFPKKSMPRLQRLILKHMLLQFRKKLWPYSVRRTNPVETIRRNLSPLVVRDYDIVRSA